MPPLPDNWRELGPVIASKYPRDEVFESRRGGPPHLGSVYALLALSETMSVGAALYGPAHACALFAQVQPTFAEATAEIDRASFGSAPLQDPELSGLSSMLCIVALLRACNPSLDLGALEQRWLGRLLPSAANARAFFQKKAETIAEAGGVSSWLGPGFVEGTRPIPGATFQFNTSGLLRYLAASSSAGLTYADVAPALADHLVAFPILLGTGDSSFIDLLLLARIVAAFPGAPSSSGASLVHGMIAALQTPGASTRIPRALLGTAVGPRRIGGGRGYAALLPLSVADRHGAYRSAIRLGDLALCFVTDDDELGLVLLTADGLRGSRPDLQSIADCERAALDAVTSVPMKLRRDGALFGLIKKKGLTVEGPYACERVLHPSFFEEQSRALGATEFHVAFPRVGLAMVRAMDDRGGPPPDDWAISAYAAYGGVQEEQRLSMKFYRLRATGIEWVQG